MFPYYSFNPLPTIDRRWRPKVEELAPNCPRCNSSNTKFCYYNNYCLSQPRYLCKGCRRFWTKGGSLRNIPIGGGCRKSRRGKPLKVHSTASSSSSSSSSSMPSAKPSNSLRPDHALENMSGRIGGSQLYAKFLTQCPEFEQQEAVGGLNLEWQSSAEIGAEAMSTNYFENNYLHDEFMEFQERGLAEVADFDNDISYLLGSSNYALETDLIWESSRFQGIGMPVMEESVMPKQNNLVGLTSLEAFL